METIPDVWLLSPMGLHGADMGGMVERKHYFRDASQCTKIRRIPLRSLWRV